MRAYVSGGISGLSKESVFDAFKQGVEYARSIDGVTDTVNPYSLCVDGWSQPQYMSCWIALIVYSVDVMVMLPHWRNSKGACEEHALALTLGLPVYYT
jgi:hypothetical protein